MEPREVASEAAGEAAEECSSLQATIGSLPEGTLAHALGFLTLRERCAVEQGCSAIDCRPICAACASTSDMLPAAAAALPTAGSRLRAPAGAVPPCAAAPRC